MAKRERHNEERQTLLEGLERTRSAIARAYAGFNGAADPELGKLTLPDKEPAPGEDKPS